MRISTYITLLVFNLVTSNLLAEEKLTEESIKKIFSGMEQAVESQDAKQLASYFSKNAKILISMPENMGGEMEMSVSEYETLLEQTWALPATFAYEVKDIEIDIAPDGKSAVATDLTIESIEMNGETLFSSKTKERIEIELFQGEPQITELSGQAQFD